MRNGIIIDTLTSVDLVEIVRTGGIVLKFFEKFSVVTWNIILIGILLLKRLKKDIFFKSQGKDLLQNVAERSDNQSMVVISERIKTRNISVLRRLG